MSREKLIGHLTAWRDAIAGVDAVMERLNKLVGADSGELHRAVDAAIGNYTDALAELIWLKRWPDGSACTHDLDWFRFECQMGARAMEADGRKVGSVEDLVDLILAAREQEAQG